MSNISITILYIQLIYLSFFYPQMNSLWSTSDNKPFTTTEWNRNIHMHVDSAGFLPNRELAWIEGREYTFPSPLEPSTDGNCVAMLHIRDQQPWWEMYPCGYRISANWICKKQPRTNSVLQDLVYPSLMCKSQSLVIQEVCYEYKIVSSLQNDSLGCHVKKPYLLYLNEIVAYHGIKITFVVQCRAMKTYKNDIQAQFAVSNDVPKSWIIQRWKFQMREAEPRYSMCGPTMQQCLDKSCRTQAAICQSDFKCAPNVCACTIGNQMEYSMQYCRYLCPPGICMCAPLMFQCSAGGCIPYSHVCDNVYDCADTSDEFCISSIANQLEKHRLRGTGGDSRVLSRKSSQFCFDFICLSGKCIDLKFVNDLLPDCLDAEDEFHSVSIKYDAQHFKVNSDFINHYMLYTYSTMILVIFHILALLSFHPHV